MSSTAKRRQVALANISQLLQVRQIGGDQIETAVAKAYLIAHTNDFDWAELNVRLGPGVDPGPTFAPNIRKMAIMNSQLRADMVLWRGEIPTIVEVKDRALPSVLGQLITYWTLMRQDNPKLLQVYKVVAARTVAPGVYPVMDQYGIALELYPLVSLPQTIGT